MGKVTKDDVDKAKFAADVAVDILIIAGVADEAAANKCLQGLPQKEKAINQCDGCQAGLPLVDGVHKDHQMFGIICTKHLYT